MKWSWSSAVRGVGARGMAVVALAALAVGWLAPAAVGGPSDTPAATRPAPARRPTLFLIGDSTVKNHSAGLLGWGDPVADFFDPAKIRVESRALGGRSSRTFRTEGLWDKVLAEVGPGDFVLMQFGHNDGGGVTDAHNRASIKGNGDETREVTDPKTGKTETVHSYGWYMRQYIAEARAKGATPIVLSPVPRNLWTDDHTVARASHDYGQWAAEAAKAGGAAFVDLNDIVAKRYEEAGREKVGSAYFTAADHTHTTPQGARLNAASVVQGLKAMPDGPLAPYLRAGEEDKAGN